MPVNCSAEGCLEAAVASLDECQVCRTHFVTGAYERYLGRGPDPAGLDGWVRLMQQGLSDEKLEAYFIGSPEYINNHGGTGRAWVMGMYQDLLKRAPADSEVASWQSALATGTPAKYWSSCLSRSG